MLVTNVTLIALFRLILHEKHASFVNIFQTDSSLYSSCLSLLLFTIIVFYGISDKKRPKISCNPFIYYSFEQKTFR